MKKQIYESAVMINAALDDAQIEAVVERIKETITTNGGEIIDIDQWGRKRLAYAISKSRIGYYIIFRFLAPGTVISVIERMYRLDEYVWRFLTIALNKDAVEQIEKNKINREKEAQQVQEKAPDPVNSESEVVDNTNVVTDETNESETN